MESKYFTASWEYGDPILASPAVPTDGAGTPPADARLVRANALLEAAHRLIVRGVVRPDPTEADSVFREALEWRDEYAEFLNK